ncbi:MAG: hypothetical protein WC457_04745 [Patescibacteria group bacterium]
MDITPGVEAIGTVMSYMRNQMRSWEKFLEDQHKLESKFSKSFLAFIEQLRREGDRYSLAKQQELLVEAFDSYVRWYKMFHGINAGGIWYNHLYCSSAAKLLIARLQEFFKDGVPCVCPFIAGNWGAYPCKPCEICGKSG